MRLPRPTRRTAVVVVSCSVAGAAAGIVGTAAAPNQSKSGSTGSNGTTRFDRPHPGPPFLRGGPAVHEEAVVLNRAGTKFITATEDSGTVQSVSGSDLTVKEGIGPVTYKTVTLTLPSGAGVLRNFAKAKLGDLKDGDFVHVSQSSDGTLVFAVDASHRRPPFGRGELRWRHRGGPPPFPPPGAAAPSAPAPGSPQ